MMTVSNINIHSAKGKNGGTEKKTKKRGKMRERGRRRKNDKEIEREGNGGRNGEEEEEEEQDTIETAEVVEPAGEVDSVFDDVDKEKDLSARPAADEATTPGERTADEAAAAEAAADHQRRHGGVATSLAHGRAVRQRSNLSKQYLYRIACFHMHLTHL